MVAALAVRRDGEAAFALLDYLSSRDRSSCEELITRFEAEPDRDLVLERLIRQLIASERFSSLAEVHPAWILEHLKGEPPRVVGLILRSLPSTHVRFLLKELPPMLRERIPNMVESFAVDPNVLGVIRRRFEKHFLPMRVSRQVEHPGFEHLHFLKGDELSELIRELGILELAIALSGMSSKALHMIYNRLELKDAKRLKRRIDGLSGVSTELYRQARMNLLEIEGKHEGSDRMLTAVGLVALACAGGGDGNEALKLVMQKLAPADGYLLKRFMDQRGKRSVRPIAHERRDLVLKVIAEISSEGRINRQWVRFGASDQLPAASGEESGEVVVSEDTVAIRVEE
jgi:hypothetical protein